MAKTPVLTTIEEDFRVIGLLPQLAETTEPAAAEAAAADEAEKPKEEVEETTETPAVETEEADGDFASRLAEAIRVAKATKRGGRSMTRQKRTSAGKKRLAKKYRKTAKAKSLKRKLTKKHARSAKWARRQAFLDKRRSAKAESVEISKVSSLIEDVQNILADLKEGEDTFDNADAVKGFANVALIADTLSQRFAEIAEAIQSEEFADLSVSFEALAEEAAESAEDLNALAESEADEIDTEKVESDFRQMMATLLDGLEVYAEVTEGDDSDDEEDDSAEDEEDGEDVEESQEEETEEEEEGNA